MLNSLFEALHISFLNKIMGAIMGVISASIVLSIIVNLAVMLDPEEEIITSQIKSETFFYSKIESVIPTIVPYLKKEVWEKYIPEQLKQNEEEHDKTIDNKPSLILVTKQLKL